MVRSTHCSFYDALNMADRSHDVEVVFVGQLPPPRHGQTLTNLTMVSGNYERIRITPVTMRFSDDLASVGRFQCSKLLRIPGLIRAVFLEWRAGRRDVLVYTIGAKNVVGIARDLMVLPFIRPLFRRTVFFVHTGGLRSLYNKPGLSLLARLGYGRADVVIHLDELVAGADDVLPDPKRVAFLPHGMSDPVERGLLTRDQVDRTGAGAGAHAVPVILFVGNLYPAKGTHDLVRAAGLLAARGRDFEIRFVGAPPTETTNRELMRLATQHGVEDRINLIGPVVGDEVWHQLGAADIFCFPSHYEAEAWGTVVLEAMAAGLPVVTTNWRALPAMVVDGVSGYLVDPGDDAALADRLEALVIDPELARSMGRAGRTYFDEHFTLAKFEAGFERILLEAHDNPA